MTHTTRTLIGTSLAVLALVALAGTQPWATAARSGPLERVTVARGDARAATVVLDLDVGRVDLRAGPTAAGAALDGVVDLGDAHAFEQHVEPGHPLRVDLRGRADGRLGVRRAPHWDLNLAADLPTTLSVRSRVGETWLDLRGSAVDDVDVAGGVGELEVYLPDGDAVARLAAEVGDVRVHVPAGASVRLTVTGGLHRVAVPAGFVAVPGGYLRQGGGATLEVDVRTGLGEVTVRDY